MPKSNKTNNEQLYGIDKREPATQAAAEGTRC